MHRKLLLLLSTFVLIAVSGLAQNTAPVPTQFKVKKYLTGRNVVGAPLVTVYTPADVDTLQFFDITGTVADTIYSNGYQAVVSLVITSYKPDGSLDESYTTTDTLQTGAEVKLPYIDSLGIADSTLYVVLDTATGVSLGDKFYVGVIAAPWRVDIDSLNFLSGALVTKDTVMRFLNSALIVKDTTIDVTSEGQVEVQVDTTSTIFTREKPLFPPW